MHQIELGTLLHLFHYAMHSGKHVPAVLGKRRLCCERVQLNHGGGDFVLGGAALEVFVRIEGGKSGDRGDVGH